MLGRTYGRENCLGGAGAGTGRRTLEPVDHPQRGLRRHEAVLRLRAQAGVATNILAKRLDGFVAGGPERQGEREYVLTRKGRELGTVIVALTEWGDRWAAPQGPPVLFEHEGCGGPIHARPLRRLRTGARPGRPGCRRRSRRDPQRRRARDPSRPRTV